MTYESTPLELSRENGKQITVSRGDMNSVPLIVWRKNKAPLAVLDLSVREAGELLRMLEQAISDDRV